MAGSQQLRDITPSKLFDGSQTGATTHIPNWEPLRQILGWIDFIYVAD